MNHQGEGIPAGSYWGRFVPASVALVAAAMILIRVPFLNAAGAVGVPAGLMALFLVQPGPAHRRWLPALVASVAGMAVAPAESLMAFTLVLVAILLDTGVRRGRDWKYVGLIGSSPLFLWALAGLPLVSRTGVSFREELLRSLETSMAPLLNMGVEPEALMEQVSSWIDIFIKLLPSQVVLMAIFVGFGALLIGNWWLERQGETVSIAIPQMAVWKLPFHLIWAMIAGVALVVVGRGAVDTVGLNVVVVAGFLYFIQGFSIVWYNFEVRGTPGWVRLFFAVVAVLLVWPGLIALGMLENWVPFRRLMAGAAGGDQGNGEDGSRNAGDAGGAGDAEELEITESTESIESSKGTESTERGTEEEER